ncbi:rod shape-determining protein MreD [Chrysiogenes arsenatis]|uniref:rod shape-determining protein MreD n=1 Tax=Chrysiogenes arsenatis TaxID=309797 RepID=UPI0003FBD578|nr:rod shape-determining protein MreD [Chrysiogenes arsenatis]
MKAAIHFVVFFVLFALQSLAYPHEYINVDLTLVYFILLVSLLEANEAIALGFIIGIIVDTMTASLIGLHTITYGTVAYIVTSLRYRKLLTQKFEFAIVLVFTSLVLAFLQLASTAQGTFGYMSEWHTIFAPETIFKILIQALLSAIVFLMFCNSVIRFHNGIEAILGSNDRATKRGR